MRRRPAALVVEDEAPWVPAEEVTLAQMEAWPLIRVQGEYWEEAADCIVEMIELKATRGDRELLGKATGTSSEALLRYVSGVASKAVRLHLCDRRTWADGLLHVTQVKRHRTGEVAWEKNLETSRAEAERDELESVREEAAARGKGRGAPAEARVDAEKVEAPGDSGDSEEKKKKKKKKKKAKLKIEGVKDLTVLFKNTGMDADPLQAEAIQTPGQEADQKGTEQGQLSEREFGEFGLLEQGQRRRGLFRGVVHASDQHPEDVGATAGRFDSPVASRCAAKYATTDGRYGLYTGTTTAADIAICEATNGSCHVAGDLPGSHPLGCHPGPDGPGEGGVGLRRDVPTTQVTGGFGERHESRLELIRVDN